MTVIFFAILSIKTINIKKPGATGIENMKQSWRKADDSSIWEMPVKGHRETKEWRLVSTFEKHFFKE